MRSRLGRLLVALTVPTILIWACAAATSWALDDGRHGATTPASTAKSEPSHAPPAARGPEKRAPAKPSEPTMVEMKVDPRPTAKEKAAEAAEDPSTAEAAMKLLREGNQRWVADKDENPNTEPSRRALLAERGQKPFVTILTCADSRLPVERIFDRGVGELFVVRVAGNVAGTSETGTIEYAVEHIKTPLLVVMGHTKCGAVGAAVGGGALHGALGELVAGITPAVERVKRNNPEMDAKMIAPLAVRENVWQSITDLLKRSPEVRRAVSGGQLKVVGAICDISTGKVEWMGEHPWQAELVEAFNSRPARSGATTNAEKHDEK
jgi:carbonic anhydrase